MYQVTFSFSSDACEFSPLARYPHEEEMGLVTHPGSSWVTSLKLHSGLLAPCEDWRRRLPPVLLLTSAFLFFLPIMLYVHFESASCCGQLILLKILFLANF